MLNHHATTTTKSPSTHTQPALRRPVAPLAGRRSQLDRDPGLIVCVRGRSRAFTALVAVLVLYLIARFVLPAAGTGIRSLLDALASTTVPPLAQPAPAPTTRERARGRCARLGRSPRPLTLGRCAETAFDFEAGAP